MTQTKQQEIDAVEAEIKRLQLKSAALHQEIEELDSLGARYKVADSLHTLTCHMNHADQCGWFYEEWDQGGYSRPRYLEKADKLLAKYDPETVLEMLELLYGS